MTRMWSPALNGSLKMARGTRITSLSSPGAYPVELPSKFHFGRSLSSTFFPAFRYSVCPPGAGMVQGGEVR